MRLSKPMYSLRKIFLPLAIVIMAFAIPFNLSGQTNYGLAQVVGTCNAEFVPVGLPLNDLGWSEYVSFSEGPTGYKGGLYPNGSNSRPPAHEAAGLALASQIVPLNSLGNFDPVNGKIVLISVGMSNSSQEFKQFMDQTENDPYVNPRLVMVNGAQGGQVGPDWADPNGEPWGRLNEFLGDAGVSSKQVQAAWVKLAQFGSDDFPDKAQSLQNDLEAVARNLHTKFPNLKLAFFSSRTRSYLLLTGLSPEPTAFETGFSVKWMIEKQINGDPNLNFDSKNGLVVAPHLSWGPYLWIDGLNERSDGLVWTQQDLNDDCTHPSEQGKMKVANQLEEFFKFDSIAAPWFLANPDNPPPPPGSFSTVLFLPLVGSSSSALDRP